MSPKEIRSSRVKDKSAEALSSAVRALKRGEVIVFPTETFYGLGADAFGPGAVERVVSLKGRNADNPIAVIIGDQRMLTEIVTEIPLAAQKLMNHFWPGPLTLVLPARKGLPRPLLSREGKIGVRISSHPVAKQLPQALGRPVTATSANPSGAEPARTIQEARRYFSDKIEIFLDGGRLGGRQGSTVVEVLGDELKMIREGAISLHELQQSAGHNGK